MKSKQRIVNIILQILPVIVMILLIPFVPNDYLLSAIYALVIVVSLLIKYKKHDGLALGFGMIGLFFSEWLFISTGVETFVRNSLFGLMPLWLPVLWGYVFVVIKRVIVVLDKL